MRDGSHKSESLGEQSGSRGNELVNSASKPLWAAETLLIFLLFLLHSGYLPPNVNEAHYLAKAKHFWDPAWCPNDFFLSTANAHWLFYFAFGWVGRFVSLPVMAWIGRAVVWTFQAFAWQRLSSALVSQRWISVLTAAWMVTLNQKYMMAGEWFIDGVEAKGFAFACMLLGLTNLAKGNWKRVWPWLGLAAGFHVLVGGWAVVCVAFAWLASPSPRPSFMKMVPSLCCGFILALPGLFPAAVLSNGHRNSADAAMIQVFHRLPHHLLITTWPTHFYLRFAGLVVGWAVMLLVTRKIRQDSRLQRAVLASLLLVGFGIAITYHFQDTPDRLQHAAMLLSVYWYRTADIFVPLGLAVMVGLVAARAATATSTRGAFLLLLLVIPPTLYFGQIALIRGCEGNAISRGDQKLPFAADWVEVCKWVANSEQVPSDALFLTPLTAQTFRWHANRGEAVCRKDMPQDSASLVPWWDRVRELHGKGEENGIDLWHDSLTEIAPNRLGELGEKYGAQFLITESSPALPFKRLGPVGKYYTVYDLQIAE
jgi:hypothetical protein